MSPHRFNRPATSTALEAERRLWVGFGIQVRDRRIARKWSVAELARRAAVSRDLVYQVEAGRSTSLHAAVRLSLALNLRLDLDLVDPRRTTPVPDLGSDFVHSGIGEWEAGHMHGVHLPTGLDEPYQHYQFAGRADLVSWTLDVPAMLHVENRTRFPDFQDTAGTFNTKYAYLGTSLAERLGVQRWVTETHVIAALWSAEVLHAIRMRPESFRAICPDPVNSFESWWRGTPPPRGRTRVLVVVDPLATGRQREFIGLDEALTARPRYRDYADAANRMRSNR